MLRSLEHHMVRSVSSSNRIGSNISLAGAALELLDGMAFGILLLSPSQKVLYSNREADRILFSNNGIDIRNEKIKTTPQEHGKVIEEKIQKLLSIDSDSIGVVQIPMLSGLHSYSIIVLRINGPRQNILSFVGAKEVAAAAILLDSSDAVMLPVPVLQQLYGLTRAETRLAVALMDGSSLSDYAEQEDLSINTVRWTMKQIFSKTGCRRQSDLIRLLARSVFVLPKSLRGI